MPINRSAVRLPQFNEQVAKLAAQVAKAEEIIDGAVWEIQHNPEGSGIYIGQLDVWQARLDPPPLLLYYTFNRRYVTMLTMRPYDDSLSL